MYCARALQDLERAREATRDLDRELKEEQQRLHVLSRESHLTAQEQADVESRLARTQEELSAVKAELAATLERYEELSAQLLERSRGAGDLQLQLAALKDQVARAKAQVDALRKEKADILGERAQLHQRFVEANMVSGNAT